MASKLQNICALSDEVGKSLSDYEKWTAFLKSAAWQYKYSFQDQLFMLNARTQRRVQALMFGISG